MRIRGGLGAVPSNVTFPVTSPANELPATSAAIASPFIHLPVIILCLRVSLMLVKELFEQYRFSAFRPQPRGFFLLSSGSRESPSSAELHSHSIRRGGDSVRQGRTSASLFPPGFSPDRPATRRSTQASTVPALWSNRE